MVNLRQIIFQGECVEENIRRGKYPAGKNIRREKISVGEKYSSRKNFVNCRKFRQLSEISSIFPDEFFPNQVFHVRRTYQWLR